MGYKLEVFDMKVEIQINGQRKLVGRGLLAVSMLYELEDCGGKRLFLIREDDIDIPLMPEEHLIIRGGEQFAGGESEIENNPPLHRETKPEFNGRRKISFSKAKIRGKFLKERDDKFPQGRLFADIEGGVDVEITDEMVVIVQDSDSYFVIPPADDDAIDIEECGRHERRPPRGRKYRIKVDGEKYIIESLGITGRDILALADKSSDEWLLNQKLHGGRRERIEPDGLVDLARPGIERFETVRKQAQQGHE